jgi:hypothetical protein
MMEGCPTIAIISLHGLCSAAIRQRREGGGEGEVLGGGEGEAARRKFLILSSYFS